MEPGGEDHEDMLARTCLGPQWLWGGWAERDDPRTSTVGPRELVLLTELGKSGVVLLSQMVNHPLDPLSSDPGRSPKGKCGGPSDGLYRCDSCPVVGQTDRRHVPHVLCS